MAEANRGPALSIFAVLFVLLALSNFSKPLLADNQVGFVLFGHRLAGTANALAGPLFGLCDLAVSLDYCGALVLLLSTLLSTCAVSYGQCRQPLSQQ